MTPLLAAFTLAGAHAALSSGEAHAQYKNGQIGFEAGYMYLGEDSFLDSHGFLVGLRGAYKASDRWWFTAKAGVSFRGEQMTSSRTVVLFHLVPIDARYYFLTDNFRPFAGVTNAFNLNFNQSGNTPDVLWGPGVTAGAEIRVARDIFIGLQIDAFWMFVFEGPDTQMVNTTAQLIFFL